MDSIEIVRGLRHITKTDCKYNSIGAFADAYENIVEIFPDMDSYLHFELAKEVMKIECQMNSDYSLNVNQNVPDAMLDIPLGNIADVIERLSESVAFLKGSDAND